MLNLFKIQEHLENKALISLMFSSTLGNDRYLYYTDHIELVLVQEAVLVNVTELPDLTQNLNGKLRVNQHLKKQREVNVTHYGIQKLKLHMG